MGEGGFDENGVGFERTEGMSWHHIMISGIMKTKGKWI